jgi:2-C-methyl-D-erythritol 4-phosphate cytidylyltransferase
MTDHRGPQRPGERVHAGIVLAAGVGTRVGHSRNKVYLPLAGRRILTWSLAMLARVPGVGRLVLVIRDADQELAEAVLEAELPGEHVELVVGGDTRHASEYRALQHLAEDIRAGALDIVLVHDAARPLASASLTRRLLAATRDTGAAVPGVPADDILRVDTGERIADGQLVRIQTPQAFDAQVLLRAHEAAARDGYVGTDTASCVERYGGTGVQVIPGDPENLKVTFASDLFIAEHLVMAFGQRPGGRPWSTSISSS